MVVINTNHFTILGFVLSFLSNDIGVLLLFFVVWWPIAASIKMEIHVKEVSQVLTRGKIQDIPVEGGGTIKTASVDNSSADMTLGMSMAEP